MYAEDDEDEVELKKVNSSSCPKLIDTRMRYTSILAILLVISILWFILFALLALFDPMFDMFGPGILFSRGAALAIICLTMIAIFLVTYDVTTWCRTKLKRRFSTLFDFQILFHRFWGFLITFYSVVHTIGHLTGSIRALHNDKHLEETNEVLTKKEFRTHKSYAELLFATLPGITGILLLSTICLMWVTSLECTRRKRFQLFSTVHVIGFPLFVILMIIHGWDRWLNYGFPLSSVTVAIFFLLYLFFWIRKLVLQCKEGMVIDKVEVSEKLTFCYLHLRKPKNYHHVEGQYAFLHWPSVSKWQWHPFSICSSELSPHVSFLIKNNGDFTSKLISLFSKSTNQNSFSTSKVLNSGVSNHDYQYLTCLFENIASRTRKPRRNRKKSGWVYSTPR